MARRLFYNLIHMRVMRKWIKRFDNLLIEDGNRLLLESGDAFVGEAINA